jgi:hypothetical protein
MVSAKGVQIIMVEVGEVKRGEDQAFTHCPESGLQGASRMLVYGEEHQEERVEVVFRRFASELNSADLESIDATRNLLIHAGYLEQGLSDHEPNLMVKGNQFLYQQQRNPC